MYSYSFNKYCDPDQLKNEINISNLEYIETATNLTIIYFNQELTAQQELELENIIDNHIINYSAQEVKKIVENAVAFGQNLIIEFATENVLMGITQAGKTKVVADYLQNVMRYAQSGSLYEVINEVNYLINETVPENLSPFVTEVRLNSFKSKIETYLGI